jgi:imidazolonepropionase
MIWLENLILATAGIGPNIESIKDAAILMENDCIKWFGPRRSAPEFKDTTQIKKHDLNNALVTPGLVDCHTHMAFAGSRASEFERRLSGESYTSIAQSGGGIKSTVRATRQATQAELVELTMQRLFQWLDYGVTTVEIKTGYGLDAATELRLLEVIAACGSAFPGTIYPTFLGAHSLPPDSSLQRAEYVDLVANEMIPEVAERRLAQAVDVFCESIGFSTAETEQIFRAASDHKLKIKVHAEQLSNTGASELASRYGALSCDHLEYLDDQGIAAMQSAGCVAVLLPGSFYMLRERRKPPVAAMRAAQIPMAVATDFNPGSSPIRSLLMAANMACILFGLDVSEAFAGITTNAAHALGLGAEVGRIQAGFRADLAVWQADSVADLIFEVGGNPCLGTFSGGIWRSKHEDPELNLVSK